MRSLYQCLNAIYPDDLTHRYIWCRAGHKLGDGRIRKEAVDLNKPLICRSCHRCPDFVDMNEDFKKGEVK